MKKHLVILLALVMVFGIHSRVSADDDDFMSVIDFFGTHQFSIDENGQMRYKAYIENASTNDTITAAESGKTFLVTSGGTPAIFTLPDAADGLVFHFIDGIGNSFMVSPDSTDTMQYGSLLVGDKLISPGGQGDALTVIATDGSVWFVNDYGLTYANGFK